MSASVPPPAPGAAPDPSMEDILASIRRILSEDEQPGTPDAGKEAGEPEVVALDESMLVAEPAAPSAAPQLAEPPYAEPHAAEPPVAPEPPPEPAPVLPIAMPVPLPAAPDRLIAPEAEAAATSSVSSLLRTLEAGRSQGGMAVHRGGPTLEDIVREEMRPLLKAWLDSNLPPLVERLVRAEIERLVGRALS